jgi:Domain of unknown function (DUF4136)
MSALRTVARFAAPLALLAVAGCAQNFNAKVNRFQAMPVPSGQSFVVKAGDPKLEGGLEFATYAKQVSDRLASLGYQPAASEAQAALVVTVAYAVDTGKEKIRSTGFNNCVGFYDPWCRRGGFGFGYYPSAYRWRGGHYAYGFYDPFLWGSGFNDDIDSYTVFTSDLTMKIAKVGSGERVFEGNAKAQSLNDNLTQLVPNLIEAMFTGFPGNSGETVKITVAQPKRS